MLSPGGKTPPGVDPDKQITLYELVRLIGPRRAGRPVHVETLRAWCLDGIAGVVLESWLGTWARLTTWEAYQHFLRAVAARKEELRHERRRAVQAARTVGRRANVMARAEAKARNGTGEPVRS
jgi:hypothetical protein